jgi:predicted nucleic acid-binding protein
LRSVIDTNIAIHLRDGNEAVIALLERLPAQPMMSVATQVELEGGVYKNPANAGTRRARLDLLLDTIEVLPFTSAEAVAYGRIVAHLGFSRRLIVDRMIAATAIVAQATLITANSGNFTGIDGLTLESWCFS